MIRILLVDDHPLVREGVSGALTGEPDFQVVSQVSSAQALRETAFRQPDVVVADVRLPGFDGIELSRSLVKRHPGQRVVVLTNAQDEATMLAALEAGARGFVIKESNPAALRMAIRFVADGGVFIDPRVAGRLVALATSGGHARGPFGLSPQEIRVLRFLPRGLSNREIAAELGISEETVKSHLRNAMKKLGAADRAKAAALVRSEGLA